MSAATGARFVRSASRFLTLLLLAGSLLASSGCRAAPAGVAWRTDLRQAMAEVARDHQPLLLFFESPSCGPCRRMLQETFADAKVAAAVNGGFVPVLVDGNQQPGLTAQLGVEAFPTIVVLRDGKVVQRLVGFRTTAELNPVLAAARPRAALRATIAATPAAAARSPEPSLRTEAARPWYRPGERLPIPSGPGFRNPFIDAKRG